MKNVSAPGRADPHLGRWVLASTILASSMAFIDTFNFVILVSAGLSWLGALIAGLFVDSSIQPAARGAEATGE